MTVSSLAKSEPRRPSRGTGVLAVDHPSRERATGGSPPPYNTTLARLPATPNKAARKAAKRRARWEEEQQRAEGIDEARADAVIAALARLWPKCFAANPALRRPLMIGIDRVLIDQMYPAIRSGRISVADLTTALIRYTASAEYLRACVPGAERIDLSGAAVGRVSVYQSMRAKSLLSGRAAS